MGCGFARNKQSGGRCDQSIWGFKSPECEAYVKIKVDGVEAQRTLERKGHRPPRGDRLNSAEIVIYLLYREVLPILSHMFSAASLSTTRTRRSLFC